MIPLKGAGWWWPQGLSPEPDQYADFAADITLTGRADFARVSVSCGSWYSLWINGSLAGHGPPSEVAPWQYYDCWDLLPYLKTGVNFLRVRAYHLGVDTQSHAACEAGFLIAGAIRGPAQEIDLGSRGYWVAAPSPQFLRAHRLNFCLGFAEHVRLRESTDDWLLRPADKAWNTPEVVGIHPRPGRDKLIPSDLPEFTGSIRQAAGIVSPEGWQLWDFEGEVLGFLSLTIDSSTPARCEVLHGESLNSDGLPDSSSGNGHGGTTISRRTAAALRIRERTRTRLSSAFA